MAITEPFDEHFQAYEDWFTQHHHAYLSELNAVSHFIPHTGEGLEIGVGSGRFADPLKIRLGVEPSPAMRRLSHTRGIEVFDAVAESLPFANESFDFVLMVTTLCFVDDVKKAFQEAKRVLRGGGVFVNGFVDKDSPLGKLYENHKEESPFYRRANFYSSQQVLNLLRQTGFERPQTIQTLFGPLERIRSAQSFRSGHGEGGFVVIRSAKRE